MKLSICQVIRIIKMRIFFYVILKVNINKMKSKEIKNLLEKIGEWLQYYS